MAVAYSLESELREDPRITRNTTWREFVEIITPYVPELRDSKEIPENSLLARFLKSTMNGFYLSSIGLAHELRFNANAISFTEQYLATRH